MLSCAAGDGCPNGPAEGGRATQADSRVVNGEANRYEECIVIFFEPVPAIGTGDNLALAGLEKR